MTLTATDIREYDRNAPDRDETETATFALGCFWGPDGQFGARDGVVRTRVGYAGGTKVDPTYRDPGDHTEAFQVDYDPNTLTYTALLDQVFQSHDANHQTRNTQYQNIVFAATQAQREALDATLDGMGYDAGAIGTRIESLSAFYPAEDYHQKYRLRSSPSLTDVFEEAEYDDEQLRESPAAAKLNGYAAGYDIPPGHDLWSADSRTAHSK